MLNFLSETAATTPEVSMMPTLLMMGVIFVAFYFILIRPENKRKKESEQMRNAVKEGDVITTIGGIYGKVVHVKEDKIVLETGADQVRLEMHKWAISTNETANEAAKAKQQKEAEATAKAKAARKAGKK